MAGNAEELRQALRESAARRKEAQVADRREIAQMSSLIPQALEVGITKSEIARLTGLSRVTIDDLLRRRDQP